MQIICKFLIYMVYACRFSVAAVTSHYAKTIYIDINSRNGYYKYSYMVLANLNFLQQCCIVSAHTRQTVLFWQLLLCIKHRKWI